MAVDPPHTPWVMHSAGIPLVICGDEGPSFGPITFAGTEDDMLKIATLMCAAPDLLAALKLALKQIEDVESVLNDHNLQVYGWHMNGAPESAATFFDQNNCGAVEVARAAIERATGGAA